MEIFKQITSKYDNYAISNYGNITKNGKPHKKHISSSGYYHSCIDGKKVLIHRLVAKYFVDNPNNDKCVNHIDENKLNNHYTNLEWCDYSYNINYKDTQYRHIQTLINQGKCKAVISCRLSDMDVKRHYSIKEASRYTGARPNHIRAVIKGKFKQSKGFIFKLDNDIV